MIVIFFLREKKDVMNGELWLIGRRRTIQLQSLRAIVSFPFQPIQSIAFVFHWREDGLCTNETKDEK